MQLKQSRSADMHAQAHRLRMACSSKKPVRSSASMCASRRFLATVVAGGARSRRGVGSPFAGAVPAAAASARAWNATS